MNPSRGVGVGDGLDQCPKCHETFNTDHTSRQKVPVPYSCVKCGGYTVCYLCMVADLGRGSSAPASKCPSCRKTGWLDPKVPNVFACRALDQIRSSLRGRAPSHAAATAAAAAARPLRASARVRSIKIEPGAEVAMSENDVRNNVTVTANKKSSFQEDPEEFCGKAVCISSSGTTPRTRVPGKPARRETRPSSAATSTSLFTSNVGTPDHEGVDIRPEVSKSVVIASTAGTTTSESERVLKVGERVSCLWPDGNNHYHPGKVAVVHWPTSASKQQREPKYTVHFDDGDILLRVQRADIRSEAQEVGYDDFAMDDDDEYEDDANNNEKQQQVDQQQKNSRKRGIKEETTRSRSTDPGDDRASKIVKEEAIGHSLVRPHGKKNSSRQARRPIVRRDQENGLVSSQATPPAQQNSSRRQNIVPDSFMTAPLFHVNSFLKQGEFNEGFAPFIREQVATIGFYQVGQGVHHLVENGASQDEIRDAIEAEWHGSGILDTRERKSGASQVSKWLTEALVGSYIIIRHEIKNCKYAPKMLKDAGGNHVGAVYVLGEVTSVIEPFSVEEQRMDTRLSSQIEHYWGKKFRRVKFNKMGRKDSLLEETQKYINAVCQPTLAHICEPGREWPKLKTTAEEVRKDLWRNAIYDIGPESLDDEHFWSANTNQTA